MSGQGAGREASSLFRDEALARFRVSAWQPPLLSRPLSGYALAVFSLVAGALLLTFASTFEFARKEQVSGYLTPADGWARINAKSFGVVRQRFVAPGEAVQPGQPLLELSPGDGLSEAVTVQERMLEDVDGRRAFHHDLRTKLHSTNPLEQLNNEIKQRTPVVAIFPNQAVTSGSWVRCCLSKTMSGQPPNAT